MGHYAAPDTCRASATPSTTGPTGGSTARRVFSSDSSLLYHLGVPRALGGRR